MKLKCVIFDMDGLMFDSERIVGECLKKAAKVYGYVITDEFRLQLLGRNKKANENTLKEYFGKDFPNEKISLLTTQYKEKYILENGLPVKEGLYNLLKYLKENNIRIAIASSSSESVIRKYLKITQTYQYIDYIMSGNQVKESKPNPEIFKKVLKHFHINPLEALVLEDSQNGILASYNAHIPVICVPDLVFHDDSVNSLTLKVVHDLNEVIDYLKNTYELSSDNF